MRVLYIECNMGAAGDMLVAALLELHPEPEAVIQYLNRLGIPDVQISKETAFKSGIQGTKVSVNFGGMEEQSQDVPLQQQVGGPRRPELRPKHRRLTFNAKAAGNRRQAPSPIHNHDHQHHHHGPGFKSIAGLIQSLPLSESVREHAIAVYRRIAQAEGLAHGQPVEAVHFHELGMMDAVADIVAVCYLIEQLAPDRIVCSPVHVGSGMVKTAHGVLPVPAPATAQLLHGVPTYGGRIKAELCTPTGAALLKHFADSFGDRPVMVTEAVGYGMGTKDFEFANCVRAFIGRSEKEEADIVELLCNLDDMGGEDIAYAMERIMEAGALDVFSESVLMKKGRPGILLHCLCQISDREKMAELIFRHTTTFGLRYRTWTRMTLDREIKTVQNKHGQFRQKTGSGYAVSKSKFEYEDLAAAANQQDKSILLLRKQLEQASENE